MPGRELNAINTISPTLLSHAHLGANAIFLIPAALGPVLRFLARAHRLRGHYDAITHRHYAEYFRQLALSRFLGFEGHDAEPRR